MPRAPRICGHQECIAAVAHPARYCDAHSRENICWNKSPRTASSTRTGTRAWRLQCAKALQRDDHFCRFQGPNCEVIAVEVDHYLAVHRGGTDDLSNLVSTCRACHKQKTENEAREVRG